MGALRRGLGCLRAYHTSRDYGPATWHGRPRDGLGWAQAHCTRTHCTHCTDPPPYVSRVVQGATGPRTRVCGYSISTTRRSSTIGALSVPLTMTVPPSRVSRTTSSSGHSESSQIAPSDGWQVPDPGVTLGAVGGKSGLAEQVPLGQHAHAEHELSSREPGTRARTRNSKADVSSVRVCGTCSHERHRQAFITGQAAAGLDVFLSEQCCERNRFRRGRRTVSFTPAKTKLISGLRIAFGAGGDRTRTKRKTETMMTSPVAKPARPRTG